MTANPTSPLFTIASQTALGPADAVVTTRGSSQAALFPMSIEATSAV